MKLGKSEATARLLEWLRRGVAGCVWVYLVGIVAIWITMVAAGDRWWTATLLLFGPRWLVGVPILILLPFIPLVRARYVWALLAGLLFVVFAILGFRVPLTRPFSSGGDQIRVLTYNVAGGRVSADAMAALIQHVQPDIVALQECKMEEYEEVFKEWRVTHEGELFVAARFPVRATRSLASLHPPHRWPRTTLLNCAVEEPTGTIAIATVHLPSARYGLMAIMDRHTIVNPGRRGVLQAETSHRDSVSGQISGELANGTEDQIVLGDFNMPVESQIYRRDWSDYRNAFSAQGFGFGYTVWGRVRRWLVGIRIDHVLVRGKWKVARCWVGPDMGSDHLPVVAEISR